VQAANGSLSQNERDAIAGELKEQVGEINDIAKNTTFNGDKLIEGGTSGANGNSVGLTFQTGSESDQTFDVDIQNSTAEDLGISQGSVDVTTAGEGQKTDSVDFTSSQISLSGSVSVDTGTSVSDLASGLSGGNFEVQVSQTGTNTLKLQGGGNTITVTGTTGTGGGDNVFAQTDPAGTETLTLSSGSGNAIQFKAESASITTGALTNGGDSKTFEVEVNDTKNIGTRLEGDSGDTAREIINDVDSAINGLTSQLSDLGASQNRLSFKESNLETSQTNLQAAQSRIQDADFAKEQTQAAKLQVQQQSGTAQLAQANAAGQSVLSLLQ
jgi:flagellin